MAQPPLMDNSFSESLTGSGDGSYPFDTKVEGYDYEFVPPADSIYECAICLFVLREPRQTPCGHRFCKNCILRWIRGSQYARCPVDNEEISEAGLFPDVFAKREIQNLNARCPNFKQGCEVIKSLKDLPAHQNECPLSLVLCPNNCANILKRQDLEEHVKNVCECRNVPCPDCGNNYLAKDFETHVQSCPEGLVRCQFCEEEIRRKMLKSHEEETCPKKIVSCTFNVLGCDAQLERSQMDKHVQQSVVSHLTMLCQGVTQIFRVLKLDPLSGNTSQGPSQDVSLMEMSSAMSGMVPVVHQLSSLDASASWRPGTTGYSLSMSPHMLRSTSSAPSAASLDSAQRSLMAQGTSPQLTRSPSDPKYLMGAGAESTSMGTLETSVLKYMSGGHSETDGGNLSGRSLRSDSGSSKNTSTIQDEQKLVLHGQTLLELQAKLESYRQKLKTHEQQISEMEGKMCNGHFYWKIRNYSRYQREAERGETTALHSQPFYTSPTGGYKLCVRANLNGVDSARGSHLSLFIHFMQGEYDDVLDWPFSGRIILSVMDQNDCCELRNHVAETLAAKPNLAAFQRPTTPRNHKGFGYMEFLPLHVLKNSSYIKNDTLIVKAHVLPNS